MTISLWQVLIIAGMFFVAFVPALTALFSRKAKGGKKAVWVVLSLALSWVGYLVFYFAAVRSSPGLSRE